MWSALRRGAGIACIRLAYAPIQNRKLDQDLISNPIIRDSDSGIDRVLKIFDRDENGTISAEASFISIFGFTGGFIGGIYGGLLQSKIANITYRESNEATVYDSQKAAARKLRDATTLAFGKGAVRWGIRYAIFCTSFAGFSTIISRFRGEFGVLEYSTAGLVSGAFYKFSLGPKGMISGGLIGGIIGTFFGFILYATSKISGVTMNDTFELCKTYYETKDLNFHGSHRHTEERDIIRDNYYPGGRDSMDHSLNRFNDIKSDSELKYNKKVHSESSVNNNTEKK